MPKNLSAGGEGQLPMGTRATCCHCLAVASGHVFFQTPGLLSLARTVRDGPAGPWSLSAPGVHLLRVSSVPPHCSPLHVRILVVSWQQALQDKGCKSKSQGTKEEKLLKRQAPAPGRGREAQEAGGTMNVENTGKGGLPTDLGRPWLKLALRGGSCGV